MITDLARKARRSTFTRAPVLHPYTQNSVCYSSQDFIVGFTGHYSCQYHWTWKWGFCWTEWTLACLGRVIELSCVSRKAVSSLQSGTPKAILNSQNIPVAVRSKAQVYSCVTAGIKGSNPILSRMFVCYVYCVLCRQRPLRRADHAFRVVLPAVCVM